MKPRKPHLKKRQVQAPQQPAQLVQVEKPIYGGSFLAHDQSKAIFVPLTLPGEHVMVRVIEDKGKRGYAAAEVQQVVSAAPERGMPQCPHFGACGGCQYQQAEYDTQLQWKQMVLRETLERGGVPVPAEVAVIAGEQWAYRNRIRLAFDAGGNPGYRGRRSHAVVPIRACPIAAPLLVKAALASAQLVREYEGGLQPTELALFCDAEETSLLATFFVTRSAGFRFEEFARTLQQRVPQLAGAEMIAEGPPHQQARTLAQWGVRSLDYAAAGFHYRVDHGAFFQVNRWLVDRLVDCVTAGQEGRLAWDLFAGVGLFARRLTATFDEVIAVESAPSATDALASNLLGTKASAVQAATLEFLRRAREQTQPELIVVDPPRTGLGAEITTLLTEIAAPRVVYVSCDPATLARDLRALFSSGYLIESVTLVDLFPQTFHLETVVHLRRA